MSEQTKHDGGPAFPVRGFTVDANGALCGETVQSAGMSLRAYFAAKAMHSLRTGPEWVLLEMKTIAAEGGTKLQEVIAHFACEQADALIARLNATQPQPAEQPPTVPQYVVEALACAEDALAKAYAVGRDLDSGLTRNAKALATVREALGKLEHPTESPASEQGLPQFPCVIELGRLRWKFEENGKVADVYDRHDDVWAVPGHGFIGKLFARLALRCGGRVVEGGA